MRAIEGLRNPAHTGPNRCVPCTVVNGVVLLVVAAVAAAVGTPVAGVAVATGGAVVIWLRGYLVPYTPRFAPGLVERVPVFRDWFRKPSGDGSLAGSGAVDGEDVLGTLVSAGVVAIDGDDIVLAESFESRWDREAAALADLSVADLAAAAESLTAVESVEPVQSEGKQWFVVDDRHSLVPHPILVAELAAVRALPEAVDPAPVRLVAAQVLRQFLSECPVCGSPLEPSSTASCCGSPRDARETRVCPECEHRLVTIPDPDDAR